MITSKTLLILNIWLLVFSSIKTFENHPKCGQIQNSLKGSTFIVGGKDTNKHFPFMAALFYRGGGITCGATIISKRWILTAAHCLSNRSQKYVTLVIGTSDLKEQKRTLQAQLIVVNGCYDRSAMQDDIAIIKTDTDIIEIDVDDSNIGTVCLPQPFTEPSNKTLFHIGWGIHQKWGQTTPDVLQLAKTELFSEVYCTSMNDFTNIGLDHIIPKTNKLCVQALDNQACYGDSGGPLFEEIDGIAVQMGITSHDTSSVVLGDLGLHCSSFVGLMYTKVSAYIHWIDAIIVKYGDSVNKAVFKSICKPGEPYQFEEIDAN